MILLNVVVNAGNASADGSENLVRDRVGPAGDLICADFRASLTAEKNDLVSLLDISYIGNIEVVKSMLTLPATGARLPRTSTSRDWKKAAGNRRHSPRAAWR